MKKFAALLLALVMLVTLCACGSKDNAKTDDNKTVKVGLILGTGGLGDKNFNDMAYAGMQTAQTELGITFDYLEPETVSDYVPNLRTMCEAGDYDLIRCPHRGGRRLPQPEVFSCGLLAEAGQRQRRGYQVAGADLPDRCAGRPGYHQRYASGQ